MKTPKSNHPRYCLLALLLFLPLAQIAAQTEDDEPHWLNPFEVLGTDGYASNYAYSAYRMNIPLREIPFTLNVLTAEFIDDLGAMDIEPLVDFLPAVSQQRFNSDTSGQGQTSIRGIRASRPKRNGFTRYYMHDMTNVERVEVVKGAVSSMYGLMEPGGIINYVTKRAQPEPAYRLRATYGTWDFYRIEADATGPILPEQNLLYRVDASALTRKGHRDWDYEDRYFIAGVLDWRYRPSSYLKIESEYFHTDRNPVANNIVYNKEAFEMWTEFPPETKAPTATLLPFTDFSTSFWNAINPFFPTTFNSSGPEAYHRLEARTHSIENVHAFTENLTVRAIANYTRIHFNNYFAQAYGTRISGDFLPRSTRANDSGNRLKNFQADIAYEIEFNWMRLRLLAGAEHSRERFFLARWRSGPRLFFQFPTSMQYAPDPALFRNYSLQPFETVPMQMMIRTHARNTSYYGSVKADFFNNRLHLLAGVRRSISDDFNNQREKTRETAKVNSPQIGVSYDVTRSISIYGSFAESFMPVGGTFRRLLPDGQIVNEPKPPQTGESWEFGMKFDFADPRITGTIGYFDIVRKNVTAVDNMPNPANPEEMLIFDRLVSTQTSKGVDISLNIQPNANWQFMIGYAYIDSDQQDPERPDYYDNRVPGVPDHQGSIWGTRRFSLSNDRSVTASLGVIYEGNRQLDFGMNQQIEGEPYYRVDARIGFSTPHGENRLNASLFLQNVLNATYYHPGVKVGNPLNLRASIEYLF